MQLYCVRHGFVDSSSGLDDPPLSDPGRDALGRVAVVLAEHKVHASHLFHSEKQRAVETAQLLSPGFSDPAMAVSDQLTENGDTSELISQIGAWTEDTVLVGHMPFISSLVSELVTGQSETSLLRFFPGTIVCLSQHEHRWLIQWIVRDELLIS